MRNKLRKLRKMLKTKNENSKNFKGGNPFFLRPCFNRMKGLYRGEGANIDQLKFLKLPHGGLIGQFSDNLLSLKKGGMFNFFFRRQWHHNPTQSSNSGNRRVPLSESRFLGTPIKNPQGLLISKPIWKIDS